MRKNIWKNIISGFGGQVIVLVLGIIFPRIILTHYGSDANGLIGTITNIYTYMALLEAGIGQAARNAIYNPLVTGNHEEASEIASTSQSYFRRITLFYAIGVVVLSFLVPFTLKTEISYWTIFGFTMLQGASGVISFFFIQTQFIVLGADGKGYINNTIQVVSNSAFYIARIGLAFWGVNLIFLQLVSFVVTVIKVFVYNAYFKKKYSWLKLNKNTDGFKLQDRNSYIITEVAWTLFSSTDAIVLSTFISTQVSSVYLVYALVFNGINTLLNAIYSSLTYLLGKSYHEDIRKYEKIHDTFVSVFFGGMTVLMCVALMLTLPFVKLYTRGVTDVNYIYECLPLLFCLVQLLSWSRYVQGNLTGIAGFAKPVSRISVIEATINIVLSVILVNIFGIVGVLLATVIALPVKVIYCTYISDKKVMKRSYISSLKIMLSNYLLFGLAFMADRLITLSINSYFDFVIYGVVITLIFLILGIVFNIIGNPELIKYSRQILSERRLSKDR